MSAKSAKRKNKSDKDEQTPKKQKAEEVDLSKYADFRLEGSDFEGQLLFTGATNWDLVGRNKLPTAIKKDKGGATLWGPHRISTFTDIKVRSVVSSCIAAHCVVITTEGKVYTWGRNDRGQLGVGDCVRRDTPSTPPELEGLNIVTAAVGKNHSLFVTDRGDCYAAGDNKMGQLGVGGEGNNFTSPVKIDYNGPPICKAACGAEFSVFVNVEGQLFTAGCPEYGQLGHNTDGKFFVNANKMGFRVVSVPSRVPLFIDKEKDGTIIPIPDVHVKDISCGPNHTGSIVNKVLVLVSSTIAGLDGHNTDGKFFVTSSKIGFHLETSPKRVPLFIDKDRDGSIIPISDAHIKDVVCGPNHTVALDDKSRLFTWGFGGYGRLGHASPKDEWVPRIIGHFNGGPTRGAKSIGAGGSYCLAVSTLGMLYMWGQTKATGEATMYPKPVSDLSGWDVRSIGCSNRSIVVCADDSVVSWGGSPTYGELGMGDNAPKTSSRPQEVKPLNDVYCHQVSCGMAFTLLLARTDKENDQENIDKLPLYTPLADA